MLETIQIHSNTLLSMCAVCVSDRSGGQIALFVIIASLIMLALGNKLWKKYIKNNPKFLKKFKI